MTTPKPKPTPTTNSEPPVKEPQPTKDEHGEELIDEALTETFPASDPVSIPVPKDRRAK